MNATSIKIPVFPKFCAVIACYISTGFSDMLAVSVITAMGAVSTSTICCFILFIRFWHCLWIFLLKKNKTVSRFIALLYLKRLMSYIVLTAVQTRNRQQTRTYLLWILVLRKRKLYILRFDTPECNTFSDFLPARMMLTADGSFLQCVKIGCFSRISGLWV